MEWVPVDSSVVGSVGYDHETRVLFVRIGGRYYRYLAVPPEVHAEFLAAPSKGKFFTSRVKPAYVCEPLP